MSAAPRLPLPRPGAFWGSYPQRRPGSPPPLAASAWLPAARVLAHRVRAVRNLRDDGIEAARVRLLREGLAPGAVVQALAAVVPVVQRTLGHALFDHQLFAACALLDNRLAEMATGEGKSLAVAVAAAVAALAGVPVHVATANDYLAERDLQAALALFTALGLSAACVAGGDEPSARRAAYACDIVYTSARELAFDWLRDHLQAGPAGLQRHAAALSGDAAPLPLMRGLCMAILDEADAILLDEACVPLVIAQAAPNAARRAFLWQALAIARRLEGADHHPDASGTREQLTDAGREAVRAASAALGGPWQRTRYREEAVATALTALHRCQRDRDYLVRDGRLELLDTLTGRVAAGRAWSRGLQAAVELKEGCTPTPDSETAAQVTYQRFFRGYLRLCGVSGTLVEARAELAAVYGLQVVAVPRRQPSRCVRLPTRLYTDAASLWPAVAERAGRLAAAGRPVLVGTDSVADSEALSACLAGAGLAHQVLNARHNAQEAAIVATAGRAGCITVATRMAGRGTDIALDEAARAAGGLHVLACQHNPSARQDRQLWGRAARQGEPGSVEAWVVAGAGTPLGRRAGAWLRAWCLRLPQFLSDRREQGLRAQLLLQDEGWERRRG